jgi:hypothetical protein
MTGESDEMGATTEKELLKAFRLIESLSTSGNRRMKAIKRISSSSDQLSQLETC